MMRMEIVEITPDVALVMLGENRGNRILRRDHISKMARDMKSGRFTLTHQGIAFGASGRLLDGQHRLEAIVEAGIPVKMVVWWDMPEEDNLQIDTGKMRSVADLWNFNNPDAEHRWVNGRTAAIARRMMKGLHGAGKSFSQAEVQVFMDRHKDAIVFADQQFQQVVRGVGQSGVTAVVARAYYTVAEEPLTQFCKALKEGVVTSRDLNSAILLRNLLTTRRVRGDLSDEVVQKTESALRAFVQRRPLNKLQGVEQEVFPLPEESGFKASLYSTTYVTAEDLA